MHCDQAINDFRQPVCLRYFLLVNRMPALDKNLIIQSVGFPKCFATHEGQRVRLVMASRIGDVGITSDLNAEDGYQKRVSLDDLSDFSNTQ